MAFKLAEAYVEFSQKGVAQVKSGVDKVKGSFASAAGSAKLLTGAVAAIGAAGALRGLWSFVEAAGEAERQTAKLEAVLKSTGGVSGQTVDSLEAHASALQKVTAFEDDTIKGAQAVLLTFKKIGGETFPQATEAALDLATVFEGDLRGSAMMVGKALEDPIRGITALRRAGVSFTADQQDVIKSLVKTGEVAKAQAMILREINSQVGGSARKVGDTTFGQIEQLKNEMGDLAEDIGGVLAPAVLAAADALQELMVKTGLKKPDPIPEVPSPDWTGPTRAQKEEMARMQADARYKAAMENQRLQLSGADMQKSVNMWESLRDVDFSSLARSADLQRDSLRVQQAQEDRLREIRDAIIEDQRDAFREKWSRYQ